MAKASKHKKESVFISSCQYVAVVVVETKSISITLVFKIFMLTYIIVKVVRIISPTEMKTMMEMLFRDLALPLKLHIYLVLWH